MGYIHYMDRQQVGGDLHRRLLELERPKKQARLVRWGALAACCVLLVGVGVWKLAAASDPEQNGDLYADDYQGGFMEARTPFDEDEAEIRGFVVAGAEDAGKRPFPQVPAIVYQTTDRPAGTASSILAPGCFWVDLEKEDIQTIFWGPEGKPEAVNPKLEEGDLPWALFWDGYMVYGLALYDGEGQLLDLSISGWQGRASFTLRLWPDAQSLSDTVDPDWELSVVQGVEVVGWSRLSGGFWDNDSVDYICGSKFMTGDMGVWFENRNSLMQSDYGGNTDMEWGGTQAFNALFVRQALTGGLYLDHLLTAESIPAWRAETFATLEQARQEADFSPYLPQTAPEGYVDFHSHLNYQEGEDNTLLVRWSRWNSTVEVAVCRDGYLDCSPADPDDPDGWGYCPAFRAEDMSLAVVQALGHEAAGARTYHFNVIHPDGTVVSYRCGGTVANYRYEGLTADQVWAMVEETLT